MRCGMVCYGMAQYRMVWCGVVCFRLLGTPLDSPHEGAAEMRLGDFGDGDGSTLGGKGWFLSLTPSASALWPDLRLEA